MAQLSSRRRAELDGLQQSLSEYRNHIKRLETNFIDKLSIAENTIHRVRSSVIELEILVSGILSTYCTNNIKERARIEYIFKSLLGEFESYEARVGKLQKTTDKLEEAHSVLGESLLASTNTERTHLSSMKNEAKQLIDEYRGALARIKEQNTTIQSMIDERGKTILDSVKEHVESSKHTLAETENTWDKQRSRDSFSRKDDHIRSRSPSIQSPVHRFEKYAEINSFIEDLNKKKEENMSRLMNIENRISVMRSSFTKNEGELKASDLEREQKRSPLGSAEKLSSKRVDTFSTSDLGLDSGIKRRSGILRKNFDREYSNYRSELSKREHLVTPVHSGKKNSETKISFLLTENTGSGKKRSTKDPKDRKFAEGEIRQLDHEIQILSNLIDSAMLQQKYQSKQ